MLGRAVAAELSHRGVVFDAPAHGACDLASPETIARTFAARRYELVINCAAWTDVDAAEAHEGEALAVNAHGPERLARECRACGALLIHYSTDYVFDGHATTPYATTAEHAPLNAYGRTKSRGERAIVESGCDYAIVRTSWLYAPWGKNFVRTIAAACRERDHLRVVDDQVGRPTSAESLASRSLALAQLMQQSRGERRRVVHVTDGGQCSWWELASFIVATLAVPCRVERCSSSDFPRAARRPRYSVLDIGEAESLLGTAASWQSAVERVLRAGG